MDAIGPLQLRVMQHVWKHGPATVHALHDALNGQDRSAPLAYTTVLSVMRNLSRRGLLSQTRGGRSHVFAALVDESTYKLAVVRHISRTLFAGDRDGLLRLLLHGAEERTPPVPAQAPVQTPGPAHLVVAQG
jgi:BlaI family penicillinase repressor